MLTVRPAQEMDSELNMNVLHSNKDKSNVIHLSQYLKTIVIVSVVHIAIII